MAVDRAFLAWMLFTFHSTVRIRILMFIGMDAPISSQKSTVFVALLELISGDDETKSSY